MYVYRVFEAIDNFVEKFKSTYVEVEISTECTFGSATFCEKLLIDIHIGCPYVLLNKDKRFSWTHLLEIGFSHVMHLKRMH